MKKILRIALESKLTNLSVEALLEVIEATPNSTVAAEVLLGIYQQPKIAAVVKKKDYKYLYFFSSYDKYTETVHYTTLRNKKVDAMVPKGKEKPTEADIICKYSEKGNFSEPKEGGKNIYVAISEIEEVNESCSLPAWNSCQEVSEDYYFSF